MSENINFFDAGLDQYEQYETPQTTTFTPDYTADAYDDENEPPLLEGSCIGIV